MAEWQAGQYGQFQALTKMRDHAVQTEACVVGHGRHGLETAQEDRALALQHAGMEQLVEHPFDAVGAFVHVFEEQDAALDGRHVARACHRGNHRQVAAP